MGDPHHDATRITPLVVDNDTHSTLRLLLADAASASERSDDPWGGVRLQLPGSGAVAVGRPRENVSREKWAARRCARERAVVILRDPRDLLLSADREAPNASLPVERATQDLSDRERLIARFAWLTRRERTLRSWAGNTNSGSEFVIAFEELVEDPDESVADLVRFVAGDLHDRAGSGPRPSAYLRPARPDLSDLPEPAIAPGAWRDRFDRSVAALFESTFPGLVSTMGYETDDHWWQEFEPAEAPAVAVAVEPPATSIFDRGHRPLTTITSPRKRSSSQTGGLFARSLGPIGDQ